MLRSHEILYLSELRVKLAVQNRTLSTAVETSESMAPTLLVRSVPHVAMHICVSQRILCDLFAYFGGRLIVGYFHPVRYSKFATKLRNWCHLYRAVEAANHATHSCLIVCCMYSVVTRSEAEYVTNLGGSVHWNTKRDRFRCSTIG